ncbi:MAG TPA: class I SAM-dependent methyltransferase [Chloroflexota bacterium]
MPDTTSEDVLREQLDYYRARAGEYDEWWHRQGRYDRGAADNQQWFSEIEQAQAALRAIGPVDSILEVACGTGTWTEQLVRLGQRVTAVDGSPEVLAINRARLARAPIEYVQADLFDWHPVVQYDLVFSSFWLSHVPPERLHGFLSLMRGALKPEGRLFVLDSLREPSSTARDQRLPEAHAVHGRRRLNDGREFTIVKVFYEPAPLAQALRQAGFVPEVKTTGRYFIYAQARVAADAEP